MPCKTDCIIGELTPYDGGHKEYENNSLYKNLFDLYKGLLYQRADESDFFRTIKNEHETKVCLYRNIIINNNLQSQLGIIEGQQLYNEQLEHRLEDKKKKISKLCDQLLTANTYLENHLEMAFYKIEKENILNQLME